MCICIAWLNMALAATAAHSHSPIAIAFAFNVTLNVRYMQRLSCALERAICVMFRPRLFLSLSANSCASVAVSFNEMNSLDGILSNEKILSFSFLFCSFSLRIFIVAITLKFVSWDIQNAAVTNAATL